MAYVNVMEWKAEQVAEWLRGLDDAVYPYAHFFLNNDVTGQGLLNLTVDDLYKLHVEKLGHQEIILESLDLLRNFHFHLDQENLQFVCLRLSCKVERVVMKLSLPLCKNEISSILADQLRPRI
jgi:connector enhancer of kinase suppressor of Ras 2